jgi:cytochrome c-type biogenesis protein CcmF
MVAFIWIGAMIMAFGGLLSLSDRRFRLGAPVSARRHRAEAAAE